MYKSKSQKLKISETQNLRNSKSQNLRNFSVNSWTKKKASFDALILFYSFKNADF